MPTVPDAVTGETIPASWGDAVAGAINAMVGLVLPFAGSSAPAGWLLCDGSSVLRATYADLFAVVGTTYGSADASHFNVPDLRGRFPLGKAAAGTGSTLGAVGGAIDHAHAGERKPALNARLHVHGLPLLIRRRCSDRG